MRVRSLSSSPRGHDTRFGGVVRVLIGIRCGIGANIPVAEEQSHSQGTLNLLAYVAPGILCRVLDYRAEEPEGDRGGFWVSNMQGLRCTRHCLNGIVPVRFGLLSLDGMGRVHVRRERQVQRELFSGLSFSSKRWSSSIIVDLQVVPVQGGRDFFWSRSDVRDHLLE